MLTLIISLSVIAYLIIAFIVLTIVMYFELSEPSYNKLEKSIVVGMGLLWPISILVLVRFLNIQKSLPNHSSTKTQVLKNEKLYF